jgi:hypothetical protein
MTMKGQERIVGVLIEDASMSYNAQGEPEYTLLVQGDFFDSQYDTKLSRVPEDAWKQLPKGTVANLSLRVGNLKKGKDGDKPWHYYYDFMAIADPQAALSQPQSPQTPPQQSQGASRPSHGPQQPLQGRDSQRDSIERQVASKEATEIMVAMMGDPVEYSMDTWSDWANHIIDWIQQREPAQTVEQHMEQAERDVARDAPEE